MNKNLTPHLLKQLRQFDTCAMANAIETFNARLRNEGFTDSSIRCQCPGLGTVIGYAVTARIRCSAPPPDGHTYPDRTDWWNHVLSVPAPRVVVIQDVDDTPGLGAFIGEMHANILRSLGCVGAVTNGTVRDLPAVEAAGFHLFAGGVAVSHAFVHIVEFGQAVEVAGLRVSPGQLLMGDQHGILSIPKAIAHELPTAVAKLAEHEHHILELCRRPGLTVDALRNLVDGVL